jgi:CRISPR-associated endonuclease/helicase Cas3
MYIAHVRDEEKQLLANHLNGVAKIARFHASKLGFPEQGELLGLLHDLGKYSQEFQAYLKSATGLLNQDEDEEFVDWKGLKGKIDHSSAGAQFIWRNLSKKGDLGQIVGQILALCVASHHSGLIDCLTSNKNSFGEDSFSKRMEKPDCRTHLNESLSKADKSILCRAQELIDKPELIEAVQATIGKIIQQSPCKSDRSVIAQQQIGLLVRLLFSCLIDADRIDTADFVNPKQAKLRMSGKYPAWTTLSARLEKHLNTFKIEHPIDDLRRKISDHCRNSATRKKGIYTLTVPTGGGKTLASLRFALHHANLHQMDRVFYVIPFTSIIDQNAEVVRNILEPESVAAGSVVLEHHSNLTPEEQSWRAKILSENWDAPVIFTTTVQLLETLFGAGTRGARRMHQLANAVLIFDEIQTLPINCVHLFNNAINFLVEQCGSTVVLCTATQPLLDEVDLNKGAISLSKDKELVPNVEQLFDDLKRVEVKNRRKPGGWTMEKIAELAQEETERAGSCLVIVNTKNAAQTIYHLCKTQKTTPIYHLSTNMCPAHRKAILKEVEVRLDEEKPTLCVSTQLIEAGVDIDFGAVIRFSSGLDSIAQAAGRCNRNGRLEIGLVHIVNPEDESLGMLPDIRIGRDKAERVLMDYEQNPARYGNNCIGPQLMKWYYQNYFFDRACEMSYPVSSKELGHDDTLLNLLSLNPLAKAKYANIKDKSPEIYLRQSFMSAAKIFKSIDAPTQGIIVQYNKEGKRIVNELCSTLLPHKEFDLLRQAQQFTVNVFSSFLNQLTQDGAVREVQEGTGILYLSNMGFYSSEFGLSDKPEVEMEVLNV